MLIQDIERENNANSKSYQREVKQVKKKNYLRLMRKSNASRQFLY